MIRHHRILYADLADPVALLRAGRGSLADYWGYDPANPPPSVGDYSALMAASQPMVASQALEAYDFGKHRHLLDIGGGEGAFLSAIGARYPALTLSLFDLPAVADRATAVLSNRATIHGGSFINDTLPKGADLISLVRILHDHDDPVVQALLTKVAQTLGPKGTLIIIEPLADTASAREMGDGYFGMYLFAMGSGRPRRADEIGDMLHKAGFKHWQQRATPLPLIASVIVAHT
jgi:demethylspheroidene O-methyltransferase